jgi:hypothetical protein
MYYKNIEDGYITSIGTGAGQVEITQDEYEYILTAIQSRPTPEPGFDYRLREDMSWELVERPIDDDPELSEQEAMDIILGGE